MHRRDQSCRAYRSETHAVWDVLPGALRFDLVHFELMLISAFEVVYSAVGRDVLNEHFAAWRL